MYEISFSVKEFYFTHGTQIWNKNQIIQTNQACSKILKSQHMAI